MIYNLLVSKLGNSTCLHLVILSLSSVRVVSDSIKDRSIYDLIFLLLKLLLSSFRLLLFDSVIENSYKSIILCDRIFSIIISWECHEFVAVSDLAFLLAIVFEALVNDSSYREQH